MKPLACVPSTQIRDPAPPHWCNYAPQRRRSVWKSPMIKPDSGLISSLLIHCELILELSPDGCQVHAASERILPSRWHRFLHTGSDAKRSLAPRLSDKTDNKNICFRKRSLKKDPNRHLWKHLLHSRVPTHLRVARGASGAPAAPLSETDAPLHTLDLYFSPHKCSVAVPQQTCHTELHYNVSGSQFSTGLEFINTAHIRGPARGFSCVLFKATSLIRGENFFFLFRPSWWEINWRILSFKNVRTVGGGLFLSKVCVLKKLKHILNDQQAPNESTSHCEIPNKQ